MGASLTALDAQLTPLGKQVRAANRPENDPKFLNCQPYGFVREVTNPLPMQISRDGDHLLVRYEEWSLLRTIYLDGRAASGAAHAELAGALRSAASRTDAWSSTTARVTPDLLSDSSQVGHSGQLTAVERYTVRQNPHRLELTLTLTDPVTFTKPLAITKTWLYTPDVELVQDTCSQQPGNPTERRHDTRRRPGRLSLRDVN